jgi:hypothetical protein
LKSLMLLWKKVAEESATRCCACATRDWKTVTSRVEHEGISFLTISLPNFGKDFERSLDQKAVARNLFTGFGWQAGLPRFLGGFLEQVFSRESGELLTEPSIDAILAVRQLTLMFGKIGLPCSDARVTKAIRGYIECDVQVGRSDADPEKIELIPSFLRISDLLFRDVFHAVDRDIYDRKLIPKHGPGATADKQRGNAKYRNRTWTERLEVIFPSEDFLLPSMSKNFRHELEDVDLQEPGAEMPVKVITVPKTLKTPRIIAIEPTAMQYAQQSLWAMFRHHIERDYNLSMMVGFDDQVPNQDMAEEGSRYGNLATLDMSEASDRVSYLDVKAMFLKYPLLWWALDGCRSKTAWIPEVDKTIVLNKYASMGSAVTFPLEAMVFLTLIFVGIEQQRNSPLTRRDIKMFRREVRVYGDDIIIPVDYVRTVVRVLESFGMKVNTSKSFWTGRFRESCGKEYYAGEDVSIVRVRTMFPERRRQATEIQSTVSLRNQLYKAGYWQTCKWLDSEIKKVIKYFPVVLETSPVLGRHSFLGYETQKVGKHLHNPLVKGWKDASKSPADMLEGSGALLKFFLKRGDLPSFEKEHLRRAGRPRAVNIELGWYSAV